MYVQPASFYAEHDIELRIGTYVERLDTFACHVALADGERLTYDALLIATGARPRRLTLPGADLDGHHADFPAARIRDERRETISVCVPARRPLRVRPARTARLRSADLLRQGLLLAPVQAERHRPPHWRRQGHGAHRRPAAAGLLPRPRRCPRAAGRRGRGTARAPRAAPFCTGYAVDIALLLDVHARTGVEAMAQVDLDIRQNRHQSLDELEAMARTVLAEVTRRLRRQGRLLDANGADHPRRPPLRVVARIAHDPEERRLADA